MKLFLLIISTPALAGCLSNNENEVSQAHFTKVCDWEYENPIECELLDGKHINLTGVVYSPEDRSIARLFPLGTNVPAHDDDELWDKLPIDGLYDITLRIGDDANNSSKASFIEFHQKMVSAKGIVHTECLKAQRELNKKNEEDDDEMIITMLTGFCHYHSEYITAVKISEINK